MPNRNVYAYSCEFRILKCENISFKNFTINRYLVFDESFPLSCTETSFEDLGSIAIVIKGNDDMKPLVSVNFN